MKKTVLLSSLLLLSLGVVAQNIKLPSAQKTGSMDAIQAINTRQSDRNFKEGDISLQELSTILQAGFGFSHKDKRTAPTAMNRQDVSLYVFLEKGIYLWDAKANELVLVKQGDYRSKTDRENGFASKVTNIAIVSDLEKFDLQNNHHTANVFGAMSSAYVSENMYLAVTGLDKNIGTVVRYAARQEKEMSELLGLKNTQVVYLFQTIGYKK